MVYLRSKKIVPLFTSGIINGDLFGAGMSQFFGMLARELRFSKLSETITVSITNKYEN